MSIYEMADMVYTVSIIASIVGLHTMFLLARSKHSVLVRFFYPIIFSVCIVAAAYTFINIRGYPLPEPPKVQYEYVHHEQSGEVIVLWILEKDTREDRLHHIPNTQKNREELEAAKGKKEKGNMVTLEMVETEGDDGDQTIRYEVEEVDVTSVEDTDPKAFEPVDPRFGVQHGFVPQH